MADILEAAAPTNGEIDASGLRLNLGSGAALIPGYVNIDRKFDFGRPGGDGAATKPGEVYPLDYPDGAVDEIRAAHVLEHFGHRQTLEVLREWARVIKPGGVLKVAVPDFDKIVDWYVNGSGDLPLEGYVFGGHVDADDRHGAMFNANKLTGLLHLAGFGDVQPWESEIEDCARLPVSLNLMGVKGARPIPSLRGKVAGCLSMPRLAFTENAFCLMRAATALEIPVIRRSGVFWGACLQNVMSMQVDLADYLLTVDYDSVFTPMDILAMYRLMEKHRHVDALCAVQMGRDRNTALMTVPDADGRPRGFLTTDETAGDLLELKTAHFGLTLIRCSSLKRVPKPWFQGLPSEAGEYDDQRTDDDTFFWAKWREQGLRVFQANRVAIGHLQMVCTWPDASLGPRFQYMSDYEAQGKPEDAWK